MDTTVRKNKNNESESILTRKTWRHVDTTRHKYSDIHNYKYLHRLDGSN